MGWKRIIPFIDYGETFRRYRRIIHPYLNAVVSAQYKPVHEKQRNFCLRRLLESPETFREDFKL